MATTEHGHHEPEEHEHPGPRQYVIVAVILAIVTAVEVAIYYVDALSSVLVPFLIAFSAVKFAMVALWFMHLRFDSPLFKRLFVTGIILALTVFAIVLVTFFGRDEVITNVLGR
jgi:cytochrome c oxidase subunit IV